MAVNSDKKEYSLFSPVWSILAGVFSGLCAGGGIALSALHLDQLQEPSTATVMIHIGWMVVFGIVIISVINMFRGKMAGHQIQLIFWLAIALAASMIGLQVLLAEATPQWITQFNIPNIWMWITGAGVVAVLAVILLIKASSQRLRYASATGVAITIALALVVAVNLIAQNDYFRINAETLGRYSISKRTEKIIGGISDKVKLTCVYTGTKEGQTGSEYRGRVIELLDEMKEYGQKVGADIEVVNITTDLEKARMVKNLKMLMANQAGGHVEFLKTFTTESQELVKKLQTEKERFSKPNKYLDQWSLSAELTMSFDQGVKKVEDLSQKVKDATEGSAVPDYAKLAKDLSNELTPLAGDIESLRSVLAQIDLVSPAIEKNRQKVLEQIDSAVMTVKELSRSLSTPDKNDPTATISDYVAKAKLASEALVEAAKAAQNIAGKELAGLVQYSSNWRIRISFSGQNVRPTIGQVLLVFSNVIDSHRGAIEKILVDKILMQSQEKLVARIAELKTANDDLVVSIEKAVGEIEKAIDDLTDVDKPTAELLTAATDGKLFADIIDPMKDLAQKADELPDLQDSSVASELTEDNIVLVQTSSRTDVVGFEQVWPLAVQQRGLAGPPSEQRRAFNGDGAIGSKVLELTHKPFAKLVLAYVKPQVPRQQMMFMQGPPPNPLDMFSAVRAKLQAANFEIEEWELSNPLDEEAQSETQPATKPQKENRVILVLPPIGRSQLTGQHLANLKTQIDDGTPAIFLLATQPQQMMAMMGNPVIDYLRDQWNIEVIADYLLINALRDETDPSKFRIDELKLQWAPFNNFSDHPVGKPLQAQRFLLSAMTCPMRIAQQKIENVAVSPILSTSSNRTDTWATGRLREMLTQFQSRPGSYIQPNFDAEFRPDMACPFDLVLAATRNEKADSKVKPNRIVVMGMAASMSDAYITQQIAARDPKGALIMADRPTLNADLIVNSAYWLAGLENRIAAGPVVFKPINISQTDRTTWMVIFTLGLPLLVLTIGGLVMLKRSKS